MFPTLAELPKQISFRLKICNWHDPYDGFLAQFLSLKLYDGSALVVLNHHLISIINCTTGCRLLLLSVKMRYYEIFLDNLIKCSEKHPDCRHCWFVPQHLWWQVFVNDCYVMGWRQAILLWSWHLLQGLKYSVTWYPVKLKLLMIV